MSAKTFYEILEVDPNADAATIRKAYLKKSLKYHPDKNPGNAEEAKAKFVEIGQAYETLSDPTKRRQYDQELRAGRTPSGFGGGVNVNSETYDSYMDAFDATVAGMSEAELAATIGTVSALAGIVGSVVGSQILGGGGKQKKRGNTGGSSFLSTAGSLVGGLVASEIASSSVRALHEDSIRRLSYKEDCRRAMERGEPAPEPPETSFIGKQIGDAFKSTINSVTNFATETASDFESTNQTSEGNGYRSNDAKPNKYSNLWKMAAAGVKAAQEANKR